MDMSVKESTCLGPIQLVKIIPNLIKYKIKQQKKNRNKKIKNINKERIIHVSR